MQYMTKLLCMAFTDVMKKNRMSKKQLDQRKAKANLIRSEMDCAATRVAKGMLFDRS